MFLIDSLRKPELYDPVPEAVRVMETHMSWILLAEPYAYKIKKPVDLGFADFSALSKRRYYCQEELRLNRRLAPELYLDVVPITGTREAPAVAGSGEPIEYAVKMLQFPQSALFRQMLREGTLLPVHIDRLARLVADFHQRTDKSEPQDRFGTPEAIGQPVQANFREFAGLVEGEETLAAVHAAERWSGEEFVRRHSAFAERKRAGRVGECHGDMHLGNILFTQGKVLLFDCIEFNEEFRWIDGMNDLAFPVMDLEYRGRADLGYRLLNAYLEATGDYTGLEVLPYYLVYRAMVRAKVAAIRAEQEKNGSEGRRQLRRRVIDYVELATRYTRDRQPMLMITHGLSGSGKTTGSQAVVEGGRAVRVRSDVERKRLFGLDPHARSGSPVGRELYSSEADQRTYQRLSETAEITIRAGFPVLVDATFLRRVDRETFRRLAARLDAAFVILDFRAGEETLRERLARRERDASEAGTAVLDHQLATREPLAQNERSAVIAVNSEAPQAAERLLKEIEYGADANWAVR